MRQRVGLLDGNCDLRLGDSTRAQSVLTTAGEGHYLEGGDVLLRDRHGSGRFEAGQFEADSEPLGSVVYFGTNPATMTPDSAFKAIKVEAYTGPTGELALAPRGEQTRSVTLARESSGGQWEAVIPVLAKGKAKVPVGNYRLFNCMVVGDTGQETQVMAVGRKEVHKDSVRVEAGQVATMKCGAPLELRVTVNKQPAQGRSAGSGLMGAALSLFSGGRASGASDLRINLTVAGAGGETYSDYTRAGKQGRGGAELLRPEFVITVLDGKKLASGNLEFG